VGVALLNCGLVHRLGEIVAFNIQPIVEFRLTQSGPHCTAGEAGLAAARRKRYSYRPAGLDFGEEAAGESAERFPGFNISMSQLRLRSRVCWLLWSNRPGLTGVDEQVGEFAAEKVATAGLPLGELRGVLRRAE
jgi:hypothetical protein